MKLFTKLALVSAIAMSGNAMAMQAMDDAALSSTTGQDGISIGIGISKIDIAKVHVFDGDGLSTSAKLGDGTPEIIGTGSASDPQYPAISGTAIAGGTGAAGAITINNLVVSANTNSLLASHNFADVTIDTDGNGGNPFLNIGVAVSGLNISLGKIEVNDVASGDATTPYKVGTGTATILNSLELTTGVTTANIQLGNTPQGAMIKLAGSMAGGLTISNLSLHDATAEVNAGGGDIVIGSIHLTDHDKTYLSTDAEISVRATGKKGALADGLQITAMAKPTDIYIQKIGLGSAAHSIGDIAISGMKVYNTNALGVSGAGAVITIAGH